MKNLSSENILLSTENPRNRVSGLMMYEINDMMQNSAVDSERGVHINVDMFNFIVTEYNANDEIVYILDSGRLTNKGFILIINKDGTITRITFKNLKPEDSEKMNELGFRIAFDDNGTLRVVEDISRDYLIAFNKYFTRSTAFRTKYTRFINIGDGFLDKYLEDHQE